MSPNPWTGLQRRTWLASLLPAGLGLSAWPLGAMAQPAEAWPSRPLRMVVPFPPGGTTDLLGRAIGQELAKALGQPVTVENLPGAGGSIGAERAARAAPDGLTLLMGHIGTLAVNPAIYPNLPYDPEKSFTPVAGVARVPNVLVVPSNLPFKTLAELVAEARAKPGRLSYGSGGNGSAAHIAMESLKQATKTAIVHIPYRGTAPSVNDLLAGQIQIGFTGAPALLPHIRSGRLRALAVSSPTRLAQLSEVPTVAESARPGVPELAGLKGFEADQWYGVVAPAGTPAAVVRRLNEEINKALASADIKERLNTEGAQALAGTPAAFGQLIGRERKRWADVVKTAGIKPD